MSKLYNGGASFGFSLNYNTAVPVDTRFVVSTLADLQNPESWVSGAYDSEIDSNNVYVVYPGLRVTVVEEKAVYVYTENEVNGANLANIASWTKLSTAEASGNTQAAVDKVEASIGLAEDGSHIATEGNYTKDATTIAGEIQALDTELKAVNDKIGTNADGAGTETVYGAIADVQADLDAEKAKIAASKSLKEEGNAYEVDLDFIYVGATGDPDEENFVPAHLAIINGEREEIGSVPLKDIIGSGILKSSSYDKTTGILTLTFPNSDDPTKDVTVEVNLGEMLDINDVLIDNGSKSYLDVALDGGENSQAVFKVLTKKIAEATAEATGLADAADVKNYVDSAIDGLDKVATTTDGTNIHVTISEENGIVSVDSVVEDYATVTKTAHKDATDEEAEVKAALTVTDGGKLVKGSDIKAVSEYAEDIVAEEASRVDSKIAALAGSKEGTDAHVTVKVDTKAGEVSGVAVQTTDIASAETLQALDTYVKGDKVTAEDGSVSGGIEKRVANLEKTNADADFTSDITLTDDNISIKVAEGKDGKLDGVNSSVDLTYATYNKESNEVTDGIATGSLAKAIAEDLIAEAVDSLDITAALEESDEAGHITVSINQENGKIKDLSVESADIASAALLGEKTDDSTKDTAFGKIALEAKTRKEAIEALDAEITSTDGENIVVKVTEEDGKITAVNVTDSYATVTRQAKGDSVAPSLTVTDGTKLATGDDVNKAARYAEDIVAIETENREAAISGLNADKTSGDNVSISLKEEAGVITGLTVEESYAEVTRVASEGETKADITVKEGDGDKLVKASDLANVVTFVKEAIAEEKASQESILDGLDAEVDSTGNVNVKVSVTEENGVITGVAVAETYAGVTRVAKAEGSTESITVTTPAGLVTGESLEKAIHYAEDIVSTEAENRDAAIETAIGGLDSSFDVKDSKEYIEVKTEIEDGKIKAGASSVAVTYGAFADETPKGIATVEAAKAYVDQEVANKNVDAEGNATYVNATAANNKVTVTTNIVNLENAAEGTTGLADALDVKTSIAAAKKAVEDQIEWVEID